MHEKLIIMLFCVVGQVGMRMMFSRLGLFSSRKGQIVFFVGGIIESNLMYRKHMVVWCGCGVPTDE